MSGHASEIMSGHASKIVFGDLARLSVPFFGWFGGGCGCGEINGGGEWRGCFHLFCVACFVYLI